ncbi:MAG: hypothetical protein ACTSRI_12190 [Promethearchaeota archaeon]
MINVKVKCMSCGEEYSYGRKIYHECENNSIYNAILFEKNEKKYYWNSFSLSKLNEFKTDDSEIKYI